MNQRKLTVDLQLAQLDPQPQPQVQFNTDAVRPISNYSVASRSTSHSKLQLNNYKSPDRRAANALQHANHYKEKMVSRVNYLAKEE